MAAIVTEEALKDRWLGRRRKIFCTALSMAVIAHLIFGVISAIWIVSRYLAKPQATFVSKPPLRIPPQVLDPKLQAAEFEAAARKPVLDQKLASIKPVDFSLPDVPRTPVAELVEVDPSAIISPSATSLTGQMGGAGVGQGGGGGGGTLDFFGVKTKGAALVGRLYDLKQFKNRTPSGMDKFKYTDVVYSFVKGSWSPGSLDEYYQAESPLYATQVMTPQMAADEGPKAFGVEKEVEPKMWLVRYSGRVTPPESGRYYFVGAGDDIMIVRFNGQIVLDRGWESQLQNRPPAVRATAQYNYGRIALPNGFARGIPFDVRSGQYYNIDILIGEQPGGLFSASLLYEKEGETYQKDINGNPILPIFRTAANTASPISQAEACAPFQENGPIWAAQSFNPGHGQSTQ